MLHATQQRATWHDRPFLTLLICVFLFVFFWWTGISTLSVFFHSRFLKILCVSVYIFCAPCAVFGLCIVFNFSNFVTFNWSAAEVVFFSFAHGDSSDAVSWKKATCSAHVSTFDLSTLTKDTAGHHDYWRTENMQANRRTL